MARPLIYVVAWAIGAAAGVGMPDVLQRTQPPATTRGEGNVPRYVVAITLLR